MQLIALLLLIVDGIIVSGGAKCTGLRRFEIPLKKQKYLEGYWNRAGSIFLAGAEAAETPPPLFKPLCVLCTLRGRLSLFPVSGGLT